MARLDDLVAQVADPSLKREMEAALREMKRRQRFGLVFEEHIPETTALHGLRIQAGSLVQRRDDPQAKVYYQVTATTPLGQVTVEPSNGGEPDQIPAEELLAVKRFGELVYPALTPLGSVRRGGDGRPHHAVINGENFHALQLLVYQFEGQVDCIYIDPPYNTGARDWKYNNRYVDDSDAWRHSKWLSMMEKRLRLAKRLLKPDGVLIVTIDENEVHHLGVLLEMLFPSALRQMVTICINPSGASGGDGLSRVEEHALFVFLGGRQPAPTEDDMLVSGGDVDLSKTGAQGVRWEWLMRGGNAWYRATRPNLCYPILLNEDGTRIVGAGKPYEGPESERPKSIDGHPVAWPVRKDGNLGIWRVDATRLKWLAEKGYAYVSNRDEAKGTWTLRYLMSGTVEAIEGGSIEVTGRGVHDEVQVRVAERKGKTAKTVWYRGRHIAGGAGGTQLLSELLGQTDLFPFPKSVYAVQDCLQVAVGDKHDALIVDFFAGSGTTLHATALLNLSDGGSRRCIIVTNNEVDDKRAKELYQQSHFPGDPAFERHGIFEAVTRPRCQAAISGMRASGQPLNGSYLGGRPLADGFDENCEFYKLDYLDPDEVDLGLQFQAILPALWIAAGGVGDREKSEEGEDYSMPEGSTYGVLFRESRFRRFREALEERPEVTHVWLVTDSEEAYAEMRSALPAWLSVSMLYRDYLRNFRIHTERNL
jgi:adenine-specific DNA-methyltransferase